MRGRQTQLAALLGLAPRAGRRGRLVLVRGLPGSGRSAVLGAAVTSWRATGLRAVPAPLGRPSIHVVPPAVLVADEPAATAEDLLARVRPGCLVVAAGGPGDVELLDIADEVVDLPSLDEESAVAVLHDRAALDDAAVDALRTALGSWFGNPGTLLSVAEHLIATARLVRVHDRFCLADPAEPIGLPADHVTVRHATGLGGHARTVLEAAAVLGGVSLSDLPVLAAEDPDAAGRCADALVMCGILVVDGDGRLRCCCPALAATAVDQAGPHAVREIHLRFARHLLDRWHRGLPIEQAALADHVAAAGSQLADHVIAAGPQLADQVTAAGPRLVDFAGGLADQAAAAGPRLVDLAGWLADHAAEAEHRDPERAARWSAAARRLGADACPLRPALRTGQHHLLDEVLAEPNALTDPAARWDLAVVAMLAELDGGAPAPALAEEPPCRLAAWWLGRRPSWTPVPPRDDDAERLMSTAELNAVYQALRGARAGRLDDLVEAGTAADLASVLETVLGPRYRSAETGLLRQYQRVVRAFAAADWPAALQAARQLELLGDGTNPAHHLARLYVAAIRGEFRQAEPTSLSDYELRLVEQIRAGLTNRQIATAHRVSKKTVENHLTRLFARTGCRSRVELAVASLDGRLPAVS
ncbi:LuxR C-terminal-related transcriptional regulator [Lentzea sp. NPDC051213]|uniref:helix-turn-helix transcriptional regulator n=1 Tax=Lentzea sp. NPDC051213 TaxID=3364126 RepID=UPI0037A66D49